MGTFAYRRPRGRRQFRGWILGADANDWATFSSEMDNSSLDIDMKFGILGKEVVLQHGSFGEEEVISEIDEQESGGHLGVHARSAIVSPAAIRVLILLYPVAKFDAGRSPDTYVMLSQKPENLQRRPRVKSPSRLGAILNSFYESGSL